MVFLVALFWSFGSIVTNFTVFPLDVFLVTAASKDEYDFHSRYFWPWSGSNEDPVTGVTHTFLTKYWSKRLNKTNMKSFQVSKRTGFMNVELTENNKLLIKSNAVIVFKGNFIL